MSRISEIARRKADDYRRMSTFCFNPTQELYDELCGSKHIADDPYFLAWSLAARHWWLGAKNSEFPAFEAKLRARAASKSRSMSLLYIYFATGQFTYLDLFYESMGDPALYIGTRRELIKVYRETREQYQAMKVPDHLVAADVDFAYFDNYRENLPAERAANAERKADRAHFGP